MKLSSKYVSVIVALSLSFATPIALAHIKANTIVSRLKQQAFLETNTLEAIINTDKIKEFTRRSGIQSQTAPQATQSQADPQVKAALDSLKIPYEVTEYGDFLVGVNIEGGRQQFALILSQLINIDDNTKVRFVLSPGYRTTGALTTAAANRLLVDNAQKSLGAWQTYQADNQENTAYFVTQIPSESSAAMLRAALVTTLQSADGIEQELSGKDVF